MIYEKIYNTMEDVIKNLPEEGIGQEAILNIARQPDVAIQKEVAKEKLEQLEKIEE